MGKKAAEIVVDGSLIYMVESGISDDPSITFRAKSGRLDKDRVKMVYLEKQDFTRIPAWLTSFPNIETLSLMGKDLKVQASDVIEILYSLKKLRNLFLRGNFTSGLPDNISDLVSLEELMVGSSGLIALPRTLSKLSHLRKLWLTNTDMPHELDNHFEEFPVVLFRLKGLRDLSIAKVGIKKIPVTVKSEWSGLEKLDISSNPIAELPGWLFPGDKLRELDANNTRIKGLPGGIERWGASLEVLDVSSTAIEALPEEIGQCKKLRELRACNTPLRALPGSIGGCESLEMLDVGETGITALPDALEDCDALETVYVPSMRVVPGWMRNRARFIPDEEEEEDEDVEDEGEGEDGYS